MKILIASCGNDLNSYVDIEFGDSNWYAVFDAETRNCEFIKNDSAHTQQTCNSALQILNTRNINLVFAGRFEPKERENLRANKIQMIVPDSAKTVFQIIKQII